DCPAELRRTAPTRKPGRPGTSARRHRRVALLSMGWLVAQPKAELELAERYYQDAEYESALELFEKAYKRSPEEGIGRRIVGSYEMLLQYEDAIKFLEKATKRHPEVSIYPILHAAILEKTGDLKAADKLYENAIEKQLRNQGEFMQIGAYLYQEGKLDRSLQTYLQSRKRLKDEYMFANEVANIYQQQGLFQEATEEYLNVYYANSSDLNAANLSILNMVGPSSQEAIEKALLRASDKRQSDLGIRTILYEYYLLAENFYEAFVQVKSIDRLFREEGDRVYKFAETMRNSKEYDMSNKAYDYIIDRKKNSRFFYLAHFEKAINGELKAFDQIPVDLISVQQAVDGYGELLDEFGREPQYFDAIYRRANLMVFYLDDLESSFSELESLTRQRQALRLEDWATARLLMGDILLMNKDYNKAKLTYTEVSETFKDRQQGALAKYKLAQLAYYKGEFNLADALLASIKDNTSTDISNDAIKLNLLIIDNTGLDTTTTALEIFAQAQLLTYQRSYQESLDLLDSLAYQFPNHSLADEILWEKANIFLRKNDITTAMTFIDRILNEFQTDIYGDDALFTKARIYDYTIKDPETAMKHYLEFLTLFPGSLFSVEVRKRIRELRQG
ncbi:MAG: tetratricopeptide repeat protein, partial [Bacteroidota bacterium]